MAARGLLFTQTTKLVPITPTIAFRLNRLAIIVQVDQGRVLKVK